MRCQHRGEIKGRDGGGHSLRRREAAKEGGLCRGANRTARQRFGITSDWTFDVCVVPVVMGELSQPLPPCALATHRGVVEDRQTRRLPDVESF